MLDRVPFTHTACPATATAIACYAVPQILFPESYLRTAAWLREQEVSNADVLARCTARLAAAVERDPRFAELAGGLQVQGRTKTLFSTLKKLLRLGNTAAGGRARAQLYDIMGLRAIVAPRTDLPQVRLCACGCVGCGSSGMLLCCVDSRAACLLPACRTSISTSPANPPFPTLAHPAVPLAVFPASHLPQEEAEELAARACYLVKEAACSQWECVEGRSKDYIAAPKSNGYQSLHSTVRWVPQLRKLAGRGRAGPRGLLHLNLSPGVCPQREGGCLTISSSSMRMLALACHPCPHHPLAAPPTPPTPRRVFLPCSVSSQTVSVSLDGSMDGGDEDGLEGEAGEVSSHATLELQIRTQGECAGLHWAAPFWAGLRVAEQ